MKSSSAVFGNYELFSQSTDIHLGNPHYYPSNNKDLGENSKKIGLAQRYIDPTIQEEETVTTIIDGESKNGKESLESLISFISYMDNMDSGSSKYNESWPTGEQDSLQKSADGNLDSIETSNKEHSIEDFLEKQEGKRNKKTLSKFLQRFREQPPRPRNERAPVKKRDAGEFWWLSSPSKNSSSTPNSNDSSSFSIDLNSAYSSQTETDKASITPSNQSSHKKPHSRYLFEEDSDSATDRIQLRTEKLLQLSENVVKDTTSSTNSSSRNVLSSKYNSSSAKVKDNGALGSASDVPNGSETSSHVFPRNTRPLKPEDDILYKWRLSHRMNMAAKTISVNPFLNNNNIASKNLTNTNQQVEQSTGKSVIDKPKGCNIESIEESRKDPTFEVDADALCEAIVEDDIASKKTDTKTTASSKCKHESEYRCAVHDSCDCCKDKSCPCKKVGNDNILCHCSKMSHCQRFNTFCYHVPPVVHVCESSTIPQKRTNQHCPHKMAEIESEEKDGDFRKPLDKKQNVVINERMTKNSAVETFPKNAISPVIHQVITDHLFDNYDESMEKCSSSAPSINEQIGLKKVPMDGSSSDDEFPDDEILNELRNRRKDIKDELEMVCEHLKQLQGR